jgi:hypothetical protein
MKSREHRPLLTRPKHVRTSLAYLKSREVSRRRYPLIRKSTSHAWKLRSGHYDLVVPEFAYIQAALAGCST